MSEAPRAAGPLLAAALLLEALAAAMVALLALLTLAMLYAGAFDTGFEKGAAGGLAAGLALCAWRFAAAPLRLLRQGAPRPDALRGTLAALIAVGAGVYLMLNARPALQELRRLLEATLGL